MEDLLTLNNVSAQQTNFKLKDITFSVPKGMIVGLIGENGAGKTTTIRTILNLKKRESGTITLNHLDNLKNEQAFKKQIGTVLDNAYFYEKLTIKEIEKIYQSLFPSWNSQLFHTQLAKHNIPLSNKLEDCSTGMLSKVKIISSIAQRPKLLILDEPTSGLDPSSREDILELFMDFLEDEEQGILFSSHITTDIEKVADYVVFIHKGEIILNMEKDALLENYGIVKYPHSQQEELFDLDYLYRLEKNHYTKYLINNRPHLLKEYPDLLIEKITIEELMIMITKGQRKGVQS